MVPDLGGLSVRQAGIALQKEKLEPGTVSRAHHGRVARGEVVAQSPPQGASLSEGARVNLLVSLGPEPRAWVLPDLVGRPLREVESLLSRYGMRLGERTFLLDRSVLPGTVLRHEPRPAAVSSGQRVDVGVLAPMTRGRGCHASGRSSRPRRLPCPRAGRAVALSPKRVPRALGASRGGARGPLIWT
jgi:beta-lactam-binding protein with PASTA domain